MHDHAHLSFAVVIVTLPNDFAVLRLFMSFW